MRGSCGLAVAAALILALAGCGLRREGGSSAAQAHYVVGPAYRAGGEWRYPREFDRYDRTGLAMVIPPDHGSTTADGEDFDQASLTAQSPVLPLPSIVRVTNLVNGRSMMVRVNDRGPDIPGRVIAVTRKVARNLGFPRGGIVEVRVELLSDRSDALQQALGAGPHLTAAPVASVDAAPLAPPPGASGSAGRAGPHTARPTGRTPRHTDLGRLSGRVTAVRPDPGPLFVEIPGFGSSADAFDLLQRRLAGLQGRVVPRPGGSRTLYAVRLGPYRSVDAADHALHDVLRRGVPDPEIVVH